MTAQIIVVGSLNTDLVTVTPRMPRAGETLQSESFSTGAGGKGANQAVAARRLRGEEGVVRMVGAVGDDSFGRDMIERLEEQGVASKDTVLVRKGVTTGTAVIIVEGDSGENRILYTPGANATLTYSDVEEAIFRSSEPSILLVQLETPLETISQTLKAAHERSGSGRIETILNPAPAPTEAIPDSVLSSVTHLIMNEGEAATLANVNEEQVLDDLDGVANLFLDKGVQVCVITLGSKGVFWRLASQPTSAGGHSKGQRLPAHPLSSGRVVDTTAAGDTFVGAYAASLSQNVKSDGREYRRDPDQIRAAIEYANKAAALCVQREGAQSAIPWRKELS